MIKVNNLTTAVNSLIDKDRSFNNNKSKQKLDSISMRINSIEKNVYEMFKVFEEMGAKVPKDYQDLQNNSNSKANSQDEIDSIQKLNNMRSTSLDGGFFHKLEKNRISVDVFGHKNSFSQKDEIKRVNSMHQKTLINNEQSFELQKENFNSSDNEKN